MVISNKKRIFSVSLIIIIIFTIASAIIDFEQKNIAVSKYIIKTINSKSPYKIKIASEPKLSIFPWIGLEIPNVTFQNELNGNHLDATKIAIKLDPIQLLFRKTKVSAIGITGMKVNKDVFNDILNNFKQINFERLSLQDKINLEIKNSEIEFQESEGNIYNLTKINARLIGYRIGLPFTVSAEGLLNQNNISSKIQLKSLLTISPDNIKLRNSHMNITTLTPKGQIRLIMDSNTAYEIAENKIHINDMIGFLNNSEFIGKMTADIDTKEIYGDIHVLTFSLKNFIHGIDKSIKLNDRMGPYNTNAQIQIKNEMVYISAKIDESKIKSTLTLSGKNKGLVSNINKLNLKKDDLKLLDTLTGLNIWPSFTSATKIERLAYDNLKANKCTITTNKNDKSYTVELNTNDFYNGILNAKLKHVINNYQLTANIKNTQVNPILRDMGITPEPMSGSLDITSSIKGTGISLEELYATMHGPVIIQLKNGHLSNNANPTTLLINNLANENLNISRPTIFKEITSNCYYSKSILDCSLLRIKTPISILTGKTKFNFNNNDLQANLDFNEFQKTKATPITVKYSGNIHHIKAAIDLKSPNSSTSSILQTYK
ncbi:MAG: hypothetical protein HON55_04400 [Legionellales bacterium]|jgi:hypothetical protein|nr:hypothetical protein [Legionellales bacterium]